MAYPAQRRKHANSTTGIAADTEVDSYEIMDELKHDLVPYDENLFKKTRTQQQFDDWGTLTCLAHKVIQHHPDRAKSTLFGSRRALANR